MVRWRLSSESFAIRLHFHILGVHILQSVRVCSMTCASPSWTLGIPRLTFVAALTNQPLSSWIHIPFPHHSYSLKKRNINVAYISQNMGLVVPILELTMRDCPIFLPFLLTLQFSQTFFFLNMNLSSSLVLLLWLGIPAIPDALEYHNKMTHWFQAHLMTHFTQRGSKPIYFRQDSFKITTIDLIISFAYVYF